MGVRAGALAVLAGVAALAFWQTGVFPPSVLGEFIRTGAAAVAFFALCGYGPARLLLDEHARERLWLYVLPVGAATGALALTLLGLLQVPLNVSIAVVCVAGAGLAVPAVRRVPAVAPPPRESGGLTAHVIVPLAIAILLAGIACVPSIRSDLSAVQGQNGDAVMAVGTAKFLQDAPPTAVRPELSIDRVPLLWRSKVPIYYSLAAVSRLAGQDPVRAFTPLSGVVIGLTGIGFFLFAFAGFRLPLLAALGAMVVVGLDRMVMHAAYGPFYNQLWALFTLPFVLLFGWQFLRSPDRCSGTLAALFFALSAFTYPLLLPFPVLFLAVVAWRRRRASGWGRALKLPPPREAPVRYAVLAALTIPVALVLGRGILEKLVPAARALAPGGDLTAWSGLGILDYLPFGWFFGVSMGAAATAVLLAAVFAAALFGVWRQRDDGAVAIGVVVTGALAGAVYLLARGQGELFWFKNLSFTGPLVVLLAVVGLAALRPRWLAVAGVVAFAVVAAEGTREESNQTHAQSPPSVLELADWDREIPVSQSIRIDTPPSGWQLWSWYMLPRHRLSVSDPLGGIFPNPPYGFKADLVLVFKPGAPPPDAVGAPVRENDGFALYELSDDIPGPDVSSRGLVNLLSDVNL